MYNFSYNTCQICGRTPKNHLEEMNRDPVRWWCPDDGWRIGCLCRWCHEEVKNDTPKPDDFAYHLTNEACDVEDTDEDTELVWDK